MGPPGVCEEVGVVLLLPLQRSLDDESRCNGVCLFKPDVES